MKKIFAILICFLSFNVMANASDDKPISIDQLPANSREFVKTHFGNEKVSYAKMESEFFDRSYDVIFVNGTKVEFSKNGEWKEVDCKYSSVPAAIIPVEISNYIKTRFPDVAVVELERDSRHYDVKLGNGVELEFDMKFSLTDFDD